MTIVVVPVMLVDGAWGGFDTSVAAGADAGL